MSEFDSQIAYRMKYITETDARWSLRGSYGLKDGRAISLGTSAQTVPGWHDLMCSIRIHGTGLCTKTSEAQERQRNTNENKVKFTERQNAKHHNAPQLRQKDTRVGKQTEQYTKQKQHPLSPPTVS